jgi:hypothetical protein
VGDIETGPVGVACCKKMIVSGEFQLDIPRVTTKARTDISGRISRFLCIEYLIIIKYDRIQKCISF